MPDTYYIRDGEREYKVETDGVETTVDGSIVPISSVREDSRCGVTFRFESRALSAVIERNSRHIYVAHRGREYVLESETARERLLKRFAGANSTDHKATDITSTMPGLVVRIAVIEGQRVSKGETVLILEAMKMENDIRSPMDGEVKSIHVQAGQPVEKGDQLMRIES